MNRPLPKMEVPVVMQETLVNIRTICFRDRNVFFV